MRLPRAFAQSALLAAFAGLAALPLRAQTMTFSGNTCVGGSPTFVATYVEAGFQLGFGTNGSNGNGTFWCAGDPSYAGSPAMFQNTFNAVTTLTKVGGGPFGITSIDIAALNNDAAGGFVTFTGNFFGGGTVTQTMSWNPSGNAPTFSTKTFANTWTNLTSVNFTQVQPYFQFDNIVLKDGTTVAPEPATVALLAAGLASLVGFGSMRNHKRS